MELVNVSKPLIIKTGHTYRAKIPTFLSSLGSFNDRTVVWISEDDTAVKFIGPELKLGEVSAEVSMKIFLAWTKLEVSMHPAMHRHFQMMQYNKIKWESFGLNNPKTGKTLKSAYG